MLAPFKSNKSITFEHLLSIVYVPDKNRFFDYKVSRKINICNLKSLIVESIYNVKCNCNKTYHNKSFYFINHLTSKNKIKIFIYYICFKIKENSFMELKKIM